MKYAHRSQHVDGVAFRCFDTLDDVTTDMREYLDGNIIPDQIIHADRQYIDMFGGTHIYYVIPDQFDSSKMLLLDEAWDNRECGITNTSLQSDLIKQWLYFESH